MDGCGVDKVLAVATPPATPELGGTVLAVIRSVGAPPIPAVEIAVAARAPVGLEPAVRPSLEEGCLPVQPPSVAPPVSVARKLLRVSPLARKLAAELDIDVSTVQGTGPDGVIERTIAAAARSNREIPHYYLEMRVDMSRELRWLKGANQQRAIKHRLLPVVLLIKAVAKALGDGSHGLDGIICPTHVPLCPNQRQRNDQRLCPLHPALLDGTGLLPGRRREQAPLCCAA